MITILISSAGRRVELINCFRRAGRQIGIDLHVVAIDADPQWSPACNIADTSYKVPRCLEPDFVPAVLKICQIHRINMVIPTIDTELLTYAAQIEAFASVGTEILVSHPESVRIVRDKYESAVVLRENGINSPKTYNIDEVVSSDSFEYPILLKPIDGSCSNGIMTANSSTELSKLHLDRNNYIAQEICHGREYTINAFYDRSGRCMASVPHHRKFVRSGEVCFAETVRIPEFTEIAQQFSRVFEGLWGNICFQGFIDSKGIAKIFEINARFGGGYPICDEAGGTFAKWILQDLAGLEPDYHDQWKEGLRMLRYDASVYTV